MFHKIYSAGLLLALTACSASGSLNTGVSPSPVAVKSQSLGQCATEVASVSLAARGANARFSTEFVGPGAFKHNFRVISIDTTGLTGNGVLTISGKAGTGAAQGSFALTPTSPNYVCSGFLEGDLARAANVKPGESFNLEHSFTQGQVFRLLLEGSWDAAESSTNTVDLTFSVR